MSAALITPSPAEDPDSSSALNKSESSTSPSSTKPIVHVYPYGKCPLADPPPPSSSPLSASTSSQSNNKKETVHNVDYSHSKVLHVVRHAQGHHNVKKDYRSMANLDARLTDLGMDQCQQLATRIRQAHPQTPLAELASSLQLVVTSPLTRCMQTALLSLQDVLSSKSSSPDEGKEKDRIAVVAHEMVRETVNYNCDRRRHLDELVPEFGHQVDFSEIQTGHDPIWESYVKDLGDHDVYAGHRESSELHVVAERGRRFFAWLAQRPEKHVLVCSHAAFLRCLWNFGLSEEVPFQPPQTLDKRDDRTANHPVVKFIGDDHFETSHRQTYENCELRSMVIAFPK